MEDFLKNEGGNANDVTEEKRRLPRKKSGIIEMIYFYGMLLFVGYLLISDNNCESPIRLWIKAEFFSHLVVAICISMSHIELLYSRFETVVKTSKIIMTAFQFIWTLIGGYWIMYDGDCYSSWTAAYLLILALNLIIVLALATTLIMLCILLVPEFFRKKKD